SSAGEASAGPASVVAATRVPNTIARFITPSIELIGCGRRGTNITPRGDGQVTFGARGAVPGHGGCSRGWRGACGCGPKAQARRAWRSGAVAVWLDGAVEELGGWTAGRSRVPFADARAQRACCREVTDRGAAALVIAARRLGIRKHLRA